MHNNEAQRITFSIEEYQQLHDCDEFEARKYMFQDVATVLDILVKNGEICTFEYEDCGYYILRHNYANREFGDVYPYWLTAEEYEEVQLNKEYCEESEYEDECTQE